MESPSRRPTVGRRSPRFDLVCVSPHYDDAVLSCGGLLHQASARGRRVLVVTVCAAPPPAGDLSDYAARLHARWGAQGGAAAAEMVARRRTEDEAALAILGVAGEFLDVPDAIYRRDPETGGWLYVGHGGIFGDLAAAETPLVHALAARLARLPGVRRTTRVLAPLAMGGHVDHQLVRRAAEEAWGIAVLAYYEDFPYAQDDAALARVVGRDAGARSETTGRREVGADADPPGEATDGAGTWRARRTMLDEADVVAKVTAVGAYGSQISTFWPDRAAMEVSVRAFSALRGRGGRPAERLWRRHGAHADAALLSRFLPSSIPPRR